MLRKFANAIAVQAIDKNAFAPSVVLVANKGAFRLDAKQREAKIGHLRQPLRVVAYVTREGCQPSQVVANLRDWSLHRLILITYF